jgi:hypothetical protein
LPNAPELRRHMVPPPCSPTLVPESPPPTPPLSTLDFALQTEEWLDVLNEEPPPQSPQPVAPPPPPTPSAPLVLPPLLVGESWTPPPELVASAKEIHDRIDRIEVRDVFWDEFAPALGEPFCRVFHSAVTSCRGIVRGGKYYIGVTQDPLWRMYGHKPFKHHHLWRSMTVLAVSTSSGIIRLERMMLADDRVGRHRSSCTNVGEGGEGVRTDGNVTIPFFLYVVYNPW